MTDHTNRAHAILSASSAHRWLSCTPSALLETEFPDTTSEAAKEGTLAHEICEVKARRILYQKSDTGYVAKNIATRELNKLRKDPLFSEEMEGFTDDYAAELDQLALSFSDRPYIALETKLDLTDWVPEGFGTADCIMIGGDRLVGADFKYGKGVKVSAENNPQMQLYALGALQKFAMIYDIRTVVMMIIQPRLSSTADIWEETVEDLLKFGQYVKQRAELAIKGEGSFHPGEEECRFCRACQTCRARANHNIQMYFGDVGKLPPLISDAEVGEYLAKGEDVAKWQKDLQDYALSTCLAGGDIPGYKAVEGRGSRDWSDQEKAFQALMAGGVPEAAMYERKALTLAALEKVIGKKEFAELAGDYIIKNPGKPTLVKESDKRQAITNTPTVEEAFANMPSTQEVKG